MTSSAIEVRLANLHVTQMAVQFTAPPRLDDSTARRHSAGCPKPAPW
jgi:hypothetical protein